MKRNGRLSAALHGLLHLAGSSSPMTSEHLALCLATDSAVVRRTMAGLRDAGIVSSTKGHGGGWTLAGDLKAIRLRDVYRAIGEPELFQIDVPSESSECLVDQAVSRAILKARADAEALFFERLDDVTLADLQSAVRRLYARRRPHHGERHAV